MYDMGSLNHLKFMVKNNLNLHSWPKSNLAEVIVSVMSSIHLVLVKDFKGFRIDQGELEHSTRWLYYKGACQDL